MNSTHERVHPRLPLYKITKLRQSHFNTFLIYLISNDKMHMLYYAYALCILFCSVLNEGGLFVLLCTIFALDWNVNSAVLFVKESVDG